MGNIYDLIRVLRKNCQCFLALSVNRLIAALLGEPRSLDSGSFYVATFP